MHINYFGTGPKATDCDAGTGMWTERTRRQLRQETARTHTTHTHTLAQLTSQFSAHNARKCQDPSENGDEEEAEDELEDEPELRRMQPSGGFSSVWRCRRSFVYGKSLDLGVDCALIVLL